MSLLACGTRLWDALDGLLAKRLADVEILTAGGPDVPALAAYYARSRGLPCVAIPIDHVEKPGNPEDQRNARLVELADAAVLVGDATEVHELLARIAAKGLRKSMFRPGISRRRSRKWAKNGELRAIEMCLDLRARLSCVLM